MRSAECGMRNEANSECRVQNETDVRGLFIPHFAFRTPHLSQDCGVISSISPCEGDGPGANPGFLTNYDPLGTKRALSGWLKPGLARMLHNLGRVRASRSH